MGAGKEKIGGNISGLNIADRRRRTWGLLFLLEQNLKERELAFIFLSPFPSKYSFS